MNKNIIIKIERANEAIAPGPERPSYNYVPDINDVPSASDFNFTSFVFCNNPRNLPYLPPSLPKSCQEVRNFSISDTPNPTTF